MKERERVLAALNFESPDMVPLEYHSSSAGLFEHGERLKSLWKNYPQDFGDFSNLPIPAPAPSEFDADGRYHLIKKDIWEVEWEYRIFGIQGHPLRRPLDDLNNLEKFRAPRVPAVKGPEFEKARQEAEKHRLRYFLKSKEGISIFEVMHALRRFEDVLMDLAQGTDEIHRIADIITEYQEGVIRYLLAQEVDAIQFGDDFGTQQSLMISKKLWRDFFKPRYERLMAPIRAAGVPIFFHSCGRVEELLEDFRELGVKAIWPQLPLYNAADLSKKCRRLGLAVALHPDRSTLMTRETPEEIGKRVREIARAFRVEEGGAWFYVEIDNGFPFENVKALIETIGEYR